MTTNRLEDLWHNAADDGATTPLRPPTLTTEADIEELLDAWYLERQKCIEIEMLLKQSRKMIARLLADGVGEPEVRRKARRLLREIDQGLDPGNEAG